MQALYRTYRPRRFSEVVGQAHIVRTLQNAVRAQSPAHAYVFCGGRGLGKTTLARVLARALNCIAVTDGEACLTCDVCARVDAGTFLDLVEVDAASNTGVDNVRSLIETVRYQPSMGAWKVYIIDEAHMLSKGAWNALLKTLEEPPAHTVFVLATTEVGKVPATIHSRAQRFTFLQFAPAEIVQQLQFVLQQEKRVIPDAVLAAIATASTGGMRDALTLLDQVLALGDAPTEVEALSLLGLTDTAALQELFELIHSGAAHEMPQFFARLSERYVDMLAVNRDILQLLRQRLEERLRSGTGVWTEGELTFLIRQFMRSYKEIPQSPDPVLPLLVAAVEACEKRQGRLVQPAGVLSTERALGQTPVASVAASVPAPSAVAVAAPKPEPDASRPAQATVESATSEVTLERIQGVWGEICRLVKEANGPLATLLKNSPIAQVEHGVVTVRVKYLFHKEQLESVKCRAVIGDAAEKACGARIRVVADFAPQVEQAVPVTEVLGDALKIFGGELVE